MSKRVGHPPVQVKMSENHANSLFDANSVVAAVIFGGAITMTTAIVTLHHWRAVWVSKLIGVILTPGFAVGGAIFAEGIHAGWWFLGVVALTTWTYTTAVFIAFACIYRYVRRTAGAPTPPL